jgi:hypothetical protein
MSGLGRREFVAMLGGASRLAARASAKKFGSHGAQNGSFRQYAFFQLGIPVSRRAHDEIHARPETNLAFLGLGMGTLAPRRSSRLNFQSRGKDQQFQYFAGVVWVSSIRDRFLLHFVFDDVT